MRGLQATHVWRRLCLDTAREHGRAMVDRPADTLYQARAAAGGGESHCGLHAQQHRGQQCELQRTGKQIDCID